MYALVDSGAYIAFKRNLRIDLDVYCRWLSNNPHITEYFVLDVINPRDVEDSALLSYYNYVRMRERDLQPIPVFHLGEDWQWLRKYLNFGIPYMGLAGSSRRGEVDGFYEEAFTIIEKSGHHPKVHCLGDSVRARLVRYPFASSDSASWAQRSMRWTGMSVPQRANDTVEQFADRVYAQAHKYHRLELEVRDHRPDFCFHMVIRPEHKWQLAAVAVTRHQHIMVTWYGLPPSGQNLLKLLLLNTAEAFATCTEQVQLLEQAKQRYLYRR